jgi:hypothetical protein
MRKSLLINKYVLYDTARTLRESQRQKDNRPMSSKEWKNRKLYGTCTVCGKTLDEDRHQVGDQRVGIYYCCSWGCANYLYESSAEAWDRNVYGECANPGCRNVVREDANWGIEVTSEDDLLTTIWMCSEKCARSVARRMAPRRRGLLAWLGL